MNLNDNMLSLIEEYNRASYVFISGQLVYNLSTQGLAAIPEDMSFRLASSLTSDLIEFRQTLTIIRSLLEEQDGSDEKIEHYRTYFAPFYEQSERAFRAIVQQPLPQKNLVTAFHTLIRASAQVGLSFLRSEIDVTALKTEDGNISRRNVLNFYLSLPDHYKGVQATEIVELLNSYVKESVKTPKHPTLDSPLSLKEIIQALANTTNTAPPSVSQFVQYLLDQTSPVKLPKTN